MHLNDNDNITGIAQLEKETHTHTHTLNGDQSKNDALFVVVSFLDNMIR